MTVGEGAFWLGVINLVLNIMAHIRIDGVVEQIRNAASAYLSDAAAARRTR